MSSGDLVILRRKETVGLIAIVTCITGMLFLTSRSANHEDFGIFLSILSAWGLAAYWVALDALYRSAPRRRRWTLFTLITGPLGLLLYLLSRPPAPVLCLKCGTQMSDPLKRCPECGSQSYYGKTISAADTIYTSLMDSLTGGPVEKARETTRQIAIALAAAFVFGLILAQVVPYWLEPLVRILWITSAAAYWVLTAWWVYLDASWRRMEPVPWGILTLVTNVFGLVTYLVIRYPDPRACPQCGAYLSVGLKRCPYCGSEAEPSCPKCQASVKPDWVYCPACAAKLPASQSALPPSPEPTAPLTPSPITIRGTVVDAATGAAIPSAEVGIDSRTDYVSTLTDQSGRFVLSDLDPRPYVVTVRVFGYNTDAKAFKPGTSSTLLHFALYPMEDLFPGGLHGDMSK